jgi:tRNA(Ser,Leu) C12 N-acetylase TAN1
VNTVELDQRIVQFYDRNQQKITNLKGPQAPKGSGLLNVLSIGLNVVFTYAFPEVVALKVASKIVSGMKKGQHQLKKIEDAADLDAKTDFEAGKKLALKELLRRTRRAPSQKRRTRSKTCSEMPWRSWTSLFSTAWKARIFLTT